jgi:dynein intermediate chain 2
MAVDRNPFYPKNFLTVGDTTCKIWCEDLRSSAIMWMKPSKARLTDGCWSPTKISVFFTSRTDGFVEVWDFLHNQGRPILTIKVADHRLNCMKVTSHTKSIILCRSMNPAA